MIRTERFKFLQLFGDRQPHPWFNIIFLGVNHLKVRQSYFEDKIFNRAMQDGLIKRIDSQETSAIQNNSINSKEGVAYGITWRQFYYVLTDRGDSCLRDELLEREGESDFTRNYDRSISGNYGLNRYAPLPKGLEKID